MSKRRSTAPAKPTVEPAKTQGWGVYAVLACATFLAYLPALRGGMLWDDSSHVTRPDLQSLHGLWRIWFSLGATQQYYPLLHSAFWVEHAIWGDAVLGYHLVNIALHAIAACLVVRIVRRLGFPGAWVAGLIFALHPLSVESVAWISEQKSVLSGVFYLAAALLYLDFDESRRPSRYLGALGLFVLALASKTVTATLPAALLVMFWWRRGRIDWKHDVRPLLPWFILGAGAGLFTAWVEKTYVGAGGADFALTPIDRWLLAGRVICFYALKVIWPANLAFFYERWDVDPSQWWQYLFPVAALALTFGLWRLARRHRGPLAAFLFFAGTLFPVLGFFNVYPFRYSYVADHFAYLASLGILVPVSWALATGIPRIMPGKGSGLWVPAMAAALLAILTWRQSATYHDAETLYRATLEANPKAWLAHNNLGNILIDLPGRRAEAVAHLRTALELKPDFWEAHLSLGNALLQTPGRMNDAIAEYETAVRLAPDSERTHTNLGNALLEGGRIEDAVAQLEAALRIDPNNAEAHNDLGNAFMRIPGRLSDAVAEYRAALRAHPEFAEAHNNLGRALAADGHLPEAIAEFQAAIRIRPDYWSAHSNLGIALSQVPDRLPDAIAEYQTALRIRPDSATVHNNLGFALSQMSGRLAEAIAEYRQAVRLDPNFADARYNLAAALLKTPGGEAEALAEFENVQQLRPSAQVRQTIERLRGARESR